MRASRARKLSSAVASRLEHYVYLYIDTRDSSVFSAGKGKGQRCLEHLRDTSDVEKTRRIKEIRDAGMQPRIDILVHGLKAETALQVEAAVIDLLGPGQLTNQVRGWNSTKFGRMELDRIAAQYAPRKIEIEEPSLLIRINQRFRFGMTPMELYDSTRVVWKTGPDREKVRLAFAVFQGVVWEVCHVNHWLPAGSSLSTRVEAGEDLKDPKRWEFVGVIAEEAVRSKYLGGSVAGFFRKGNQSPVVYVNIKPKPQSRNRSTR